ncbi:hypothetical protein CcrC1_gp115 [Caulobacter phage C1]|nr:hypothetical protein CcrC1_gp115 [Caulobacter phage C1]UTU08343.1 hypothetical protein CcrC2_gp115 [Caulobacter phage C2]UTU09417.1 hypothetical protein CcrBL47_gp131 [Caulobacter phage BL47]UTU09977.1 hypothetical protein CcrRB23_gp115 [Caulobacter phage RB23]WGN97002.1 hypothetical protein [Bertelyvirus sp.]
MPSLSYPVHAKLFNWMKGASFGAAPTSLKVGLLTAPPNPDGTGIVEPVGGGYARQTLVLGAIAVADGISTAKNDNAVIFGAATVQWPAVTHLGVFGSDGTLLFYGPLAASRVCTVGDSIAFGIGAIQLRLR